jgi:hypothetical protein
MADREPGWLGRQFRGVGATEPTGTSPARGAWAQRLTYVVLPVGLLAGGTAGFVTSTHGGTTGVSWALGWSVGVLVLCICVIVGRLLRPPPR